MANAYTLTCDVSMCLVAAGRDGMVPFHAGIRSDAQCNPFGTNTGIISMY